VFLVILFLEKLVNNMPASCADISFLAPLTPKTLGLLLNDYTISLCNFFLAVLTLYTWSMCHQSESDFPYTFLPYLLVYFIHLGCFYTEVKHQKSSLHSYKVDVLNNVKSCWRILCYIFFITN